MRIDSERVLEAAGLKVKAKKGSALDTLKEGDSIKVKVLSSDKDSALLKTPDGQLIKTKLSPGVTLSAGEDATLTVASKSDGEILLSVVQGDTEDGGGAEGTSTRQGPARNFEDKTLANMAKTLSELNIPVRESTARAMRELMAAHSGMTAEEAAFLASNNVSPESPLIKAALSLINDGVKTDELVGGLMDLLESVQPDGAEQAVTGNEPNGIGRLLQGVRTDGSERIFQAAAGIADGMTAAHIADGLTAAGMTADGTLSASGAGEMPLTDWITKLAEIAADVTVTDYEISAEIAGAENHAAKSDNIPQNGIISQDNIKLQVTSEIQIETVFSEVQTAAEAGSELLNAGEDAAGTPLPGKEADGVRIVPGNAAAGPAETIAPGEQTVKPLTNAPDEKIIPQVPPGDQTAHTSVNEKIVAAIVSVLEEIPEFKGTPPSVLEKFSNTLLRTAQDNADLSHDAAAKLPEMLDKLFYKLVKNDEKSGERLRQAKEELFVRLSLIEETVSSASHPAKTELVAQTRRLIDHVKLLNSIEQFVYVQIPIKAGEDRKTADMYVYKRKGGKRADAEDVNILLSLDLEHMGHWESLVNIKGKDVSLRMEVAGEREKEFISENTVKLHELLSEAGFKLGGVNISHSMAETTPLTALSALDRYKNGRGNAVDFKI